MAAGGDKQGEVVCSTACRISLKLHIETGVEFEVQCNTAITFELSEIIVVYSVLHFKGREQ